MDNVWDTCTSGVHVNAPDVGASTPVTITDTQPYDKPLKANKSKASCCVPKCHTPGYIVEGNSTVTYHSLPINDKERLSKWISKIKRDPGEKFSINKHTKICSRHFRKTDYFITPKGRRFIKENATPSIFRWRDEQKERRKIKKYPLESNDCDVAVYHAESSSNGEERSQELDQLRQECERLRKALQLQKEAAELFQKERDYLKQLLQQERCKKSNFNMEQIIHNNKLVTFYTGFPSASEMNECFRVLDPGDKGRNIIYVDSQTNTDKRAPSSKPKKLEIRDEFLLVLVRLRLGLYEDDLAFRFQISRSTVSRIWLSWINYMYLRLGQINIWPGQDCIKRTMPDSMKQKYPNLEWILDAFEIQTQRPSSLVLQSQAYSNYKSRTTLKGLLACTPSGQIGFISQLYTGSISDRELTIRSGFLNMKHHKNAMWLVDKGFQIQDLAEPLGVKINMPAFVGQRKQMTASEVFHTQQVASERIHIERAINKVKNFHIFDSPIPLTMYGTINQIWTVCSLLTLFQNPIISA